MLQGPKHKNSQDTKYVRICVADALPEGVTLALRTPHEPAGLDATDRNLEEVVVLLKSRYMAVLSVGLFRAQARRLHLSPAGAVFGAHMPAPPTIGE